MLDRWTELYFENDFGRSERKPLELVLKMLEDGEVEEARMPRPTRRHPDRTRLVFRWKGPREDAWAAAFERRGLSAQMPPSVTVGSVVLNRPDCHAFVDAWHGHITPAFRGLRSIPAGIRLLVNPVVASA